MGWDLDRFPEANKDLICCICVGILEDPVEIRCRHVYCRGCLNTWIRARPDPICPTCRASTRACEIRQVVPVLRNILGRQVIYCENRENGCLESPTLDSLESHSRKCQYGKVECKNTGCTVQTLRRNINFHANICPKRVVSCQHGCALIMSHEESEQHNCISALRSYFTVQMNNLQEQIHKLQETIDSMANCQSQESQTNASRILHREGDSTTLAGISSSPETEDSLLVDLFDEDEFNIMPNRMSENPPPAVQITETLPRLFFRSASVERAHQARRRRRMEQGNPIGIRRLLRHRVSSNTTDRRESREDEDLSTDILVEEF